MLEKTLQNIGLSEKQAKIYLALLELGQATVQSLARRAKINRPTAYVILEELLKEKLVFSAPAGKKVYYRAAAPESLADWLKAKKRELTDKTQELRSAVKDIKARYEPGARATVRYFTGKEGLLETVRNIMEDVKDTKIQMFYNVDNVDKYFTLEERKALKQNRLNKNINTEVIYVSFDRRLNKATYGDVRIRISKDDFPNECDIALYPKDKIRIVFFSGGDPSGIIIQDKNMHQAILSLFRLAWMGARKKEIE